MKLRLFQFSGVVVGQAHNPTILNPDFLAAEGIVPKSWDWKIADTMTTPPFAMVRYENGVTVTVEQSKLQVSDPNVEDGPEKSKVGEIASAYVKTLRHVRYTSVGNNFQSLIQIESPESFLKRRFLKKGPWNGSERTLEAVGIRLIYPLNPGKLTVSIDSGEARLPDDANKQQVILANANFNRVCADHPAFEEVSAFLQKAAQDWAMYQALLSEIVGTRERDDS
jgi:hypothetical protein